ncbi:MAG TPA: hypothetical protein VMG60_05195 [Burkholderiaceae bacterium]|nr:hypothetical protein [Burkholderiaceae bacterium]
MSGRLACVAAALCAAGSFGPVRADTQAADGLQFTGQLNFYMPSVGGRTVFGQAGSGVEIGIDPNKVLEHRNPAFMGTLEARRGRWGGFMDLTYVDLGNSKAASTQLTIGGIDLPADANAQLDYHLRGGAWTIAGTYRGIPDRDSPADLLAGFRLLEIRQSLGWQTAGNIGSIPAAGRSGDAAFNVDNWDVVFGVKGRLTMVRDRKWFIPYYVDIGSGDSKLTWQLMLGFGWAFPWGDLVASWRHLDYRMKSGGNVDSLNFDGPAVGVLWRW